MEARLEAVYKTGALCHPNFGSTRIAMTRESDVGSGPYDSESELVD